MKKLTILLIAMLTLGCQKEQWDPEVLKAELIDTQEKTFCYKCQETYSFEFFRPAFQTLNYNQTLEPYTICDVTDSYIAALIDSFNVDTIIYVTDKYFFDFEQGIYAHKKITDGDSVGREINYMECTKFE